MCCIARWHDQLIRRIGSPLLECSVEHRNLELGIGILQYSTNGFDVDCFFRVIKLLEEQ